MKCLQNIRIVKWSHKLYDPFFFRRKSKLEYCISISFLQGCNVWASSLGGLVAVIYMSIVRDPQRWSYLYLIGTQVGTLMFLNCLQIAGQNIAALDTNPYTINQVLLIQLPSVFSNIVFNQKALCKCCMFIKMSFQFYPTRVLANIFLVRSIYILL